MPGRGHTSTRPTTTGERPTGGERGVPLRAVADPTALRACAEAYLALLRDLDRTERHDPQRSAAVRLDLLRVRHAHRRGELGPADALVRLTELAARLERGTDPARSTGL